MNFSEKLMNLRKKEGLSQEEVGEKLGVSRQTVSKWESAQSYPDFQKLVAISDYFQLSLDELMRDIDVSDVRMKNQNEEKISDMYEDVQTFKKALNIILNVFAFIGVTGILILLTIIILWG